MSENIDIPGTFGIVIFLILPVLIISSLLLSNNLVIQFTLVMNLVALSILFGAGMQSKKSVKGDKA